MARKWKLVDTALTITGLLALAVGWYNNSTPLALATLVIVGILLFRS